MTGPPLQLSIDVEAPDGTHNRWGPDEPNAENVITDITFSHTMPGGFEQLSCTLQRKPSIDYSDLAEFSTITVYGPGGQIAWQGRIETTPRTSGDQLAITVGAVGWQAHLDDNQAVRELYLDIDLTKWISPSVQRQADLSAWQLGSFAVVPTNTLALTLTGAWATEAMSEAWYDASDLQIGYMYYAWNSGGGVTGATDTSWSWGPFLSSDAIATSFDSVGSLRAAGPGQGVITATGPRSFALVQFFYNSGGAAGAAGFVYNLNWSYLGVVGNQNLPSIVRGTLTSTGGIGLLASDIIQHAVNKWAPKLATSRAGSSTIEQSTFVIPHAAFLDPTTVSAIISEVNQYELLDWWVDDGPTFNLASRGNHGREWQARVGPSGLQETGPQVDRIYNGAIVSYRDVTGVTRTVGPPGSGMNTEDATLFDPDATNPATAAGLTRNAPPIQMGTSTAAGAIAIGQRFLAEQKRASTAGQAQLVGTVRDASGVNRPAWMVRAGDTITFVDAHDPSPRTITKASYTDSTLTCQIDLDSPPQGLQAWLARTSVALSSLGLT